IILTAGAGWGVLLLFQIATGQSFTGVSIHHINAHGHAQIFGWVVLFIMGFAYEIFPRIWRARPVDLTLARVVFGCMLIGLITSIIGIATPGSWGSVGMATLGGVLQVVACTIFAI